MDIDIEKLKYLFGFMDEYFDILISRVVGKNSNISKYSATQLYNMISYYIDIEKELGTDLPFNNVKTYFMYNLNSKYEYFKFKLSVFKEIKHKEIIKPVLSNNEKIIYILRFMEEYICISINEVLTDFKTDPEYSAVAVTNMIKCYIKIKNQLGENMSFCDVETFFKVKKYSEDDYMQFEESRKSESEYYRDVQY